MASLEKAIAIAVEAHAGVVDKGGHPYVLHPLRVMFSVESEHERIAAVLHDVVEDTAWTLEQLAGEGFADEVVAAIDALTKRDGEQRLDAAKRARRDPIARQVKIADVTDNMDISRIPEPTARDHERLQEYAAVIAYLRDGGPN